MRKQLRVADIANGRAFDYHVSIMGIDSWHVNNAIINVTYSDGETFVADLRGLADARLAVRQINKQLREHNVVNRVIKAVYRGN